MDFRAKYTQSKTDNEGNIPCKYCDLTFKSSSGFNNHMNRKHPLDITSGLHCYTCNKAFTKREIMYQHYKTVLHQINCKKLKDELSEMPFEENIEENPFSAPHMNKPYRKLLMEKKVPIIKITPRPDVLHLRKETAIIPIEATAPQHDPRRRTEFSFLDIVDNYNGDTPSSFAQEYTSEVPTENCIEISPIDDCKLLQKGPDIHGNEENEEKLDKREIASGSRDLLDLPDTQNEHLCTESLVPDMFDTISLETFHNLIFGTDNNNKKEKTEENDIPTEITSNLLDPPRKQPIATEAPDPEISSFLDYLQEQQL